MQSLWCYSSEKSLGSFPLRSIQSKGVKRQIVPIKATQFNLKVRKEGNFYIFLYILKSFNVLVQSTCVTFEIVMAHIYHPQWTPAKDALRSNLVKG